MCKKKFNYIKTTMNMMNIKINMLGNNNMMNNNYIKPNSNSQVNITYDFVVSDPSKGEFNIKVKVIVDLQFKN